MNLLKRIAPWYAIVGAAFFFYGYYLMMFTGKTGESVMFIAAFLLFIYASVSMDDEWVIKIGDNVYEE